MDSSRLLEKTLDLVRTRSRQITYKQIADDTGISQRWVESFAQSRIPDPGVIKVEKLYKYFTNSELDI